MADLRFNAIAKTYKQGRFGYPPAVYEAILDFAGRERLEVALDLGCGTGLSLEGLAAIADRVIGIEPADEMRAAARERLPEADIRAGSAEVTGLEDASCDAVTVATAFHWFDPEKALAEAARILRPGGVLAVYRYDFPVIAGPGHLVLERHNRRFWNKHRAPVLGRYDDTLERMEASGHFARCEHRFIPYLVPMTAEALAAFCASTSYGSAYGATLDDPETYFRAFAEEVAAAQPGELQVAFDIYMFLAGL